MGKDGLGDKVEKVIETVLPRTAKRKCSKCQKRKRRLNKWGEKIGFSKNKK